MRARPLIVVVFGLLGRLAVAQAAPEAADCKQALDALEAQEAAMAREQTPADTSPQGRQQAAQSRLAPFRDQAIKTCLGGRPMTAPPSQHLVRAPISVPSLTLTLPPARPMTSPSTGLPSATPLRPPSPPVVVTHCDVAGCWASDGTHLQRAGGSLIGPRGICTTVGTVLNCP
ncbi:MAG: hypothetical protein HY021_02120 [Burkholderiales bacterium]|nr:hypothetical protein [Burkholderiales bacterium]